MSRSVNKVILLGNLGKDCEVRFTPTGVQCGQFSVATSRRWKDKQSDEWKEETDWHNVIFWRCDNVAQYLTKGTQVYVEGRLQTRSYEKDQVKRWVTEVVADEVVLLGGKREGSGAGAPAPDDAGAASDDDVPF
jgi:single-strand DNA-binding protein